MIEAEKLEWNCDQPVSGGFRALFKGRQFKDNKIITFRRETFQAYIQLNLYKQYINYVCDEQLKYTIENIVKQTTKIFKFNILNYFQINRQ